MLNFLDLVFGTTISGYYTFSLENNLVCAYFFYFAGFSTVADLFDFLGGMPKILIMIDKIKKLNHLKLNIPFTIS